MLVDDHETVAVLQEQKGVPILTDETTEGGVGGSRFGSGPRRRVVAGDRRLSALGRLAKTDLGVYIVRRVGKERRPAGKAAPHQLTVSSAPALGHKVPFRFTLIEPADHDPALGGGDTPPHGPLDEGEDRTCMSEPDLGLGRVDVDIDGIRRQPQIDHHTCPAEPAATATQNP
jgi:hypothetical protein